MRFRTSNKYRQGNRNSRRSDESMTREEFKLIVKGMKAICTKPDFIPDQDAFNVWYMLLADLDYKKASIATQMHMRSSTFEPKPADIIEQYNKLVKRAEITEMEAWSLVSKALRNGINGAEEEFNKLPPIVQKAVGGPSQLRFWATSDEGSIESVVQSNFMRTYRTECKRQREFDKLPNDVKQLIANTNQQLLEG